MDLVIWTSSILKWILYQPCGISYKWDYRVYNHNPGKNDEIGIPGTKWMINLTIPKRWGLIATFLCICIAPVGLSAQEDLVGYRLTVQIHEAPALNSYYLFYFNTVELAGKDDPAENRTVKLVMPKGIEALGGISAYPSKNTSALALQWEETDEEVTMSITTDAPSFELRYYLPMRAREIGSNQDHLLIFPEPRIDMPLKSLTISINWPNWKYQVHKIEPEGAEQVMNPMFETDPYKVVSYYWYYTGIEANSRESGDISVTLRSAQAVSRVTRNQSILIFAAVVCIPTAIFIAIHPPQRGRMEEKRKKFRITDERERRREVRRGRYKVR